MTPSVMLRIVESSTIDLPLGCDYSYNVTKFYKNLPKSHNNLRSIDSCSVAKTQNKVACQKRGFSLVD
jgi:hypothetical protein